MGVNKVVLGNRTLIDLTAVTVTPEVLLDGYTAYDASGNLITGTYGREEVNLFDASSEDVVINGRFNSSGNAVSYAAGQLVTNYIEASVGDIFVIETDKSLKTNSYTGMVECLDANKTYITSTIPQGASAVWAFNSDSTKGVCTIPSSWSGHDYSATAYVRFCVAYTDTANIKITKTTEPPVLG